MSACSDAPPERTAARHEPTQARRHPPGARLPARGVHDHLPDGQLVLDELPRLSISRAAWSSAASSASRTTSRPSRTIRSSGRSCGSPSTFVVIDVSADHPGRPRPGDPAPAGRLRADHPAHADHPALRHEPGADRHLLALHAEPRLRRLRADDRRGASRSCATSTISRARRSRWGRSISADVWHWAPYFTFMLMGGLASIPPETQEAARIDGASNWRVFRDVTLPQLAPVLAVAIILKSVFALKVFDSIVTMTSGGPGRSTTTLSYFAYHHRLPRLRFRLRGRGRLHPHRHPVPALALLHALRVPEVSMTAAATRSPPNAAADGAPRRRERRRRDPQGAGDRGPARRRASSILFPIVWMVLTAFKSPVYVYRYTIWFPPTLENFREVFNERWGDRREDHQQHRHRGLDRRRSRSRSPSAAAYAFSRLTFPLKRADVPVDPADAVHPGGHDRPAVLRHVPPARPARHLRRPDHRRSRDRASLRDLDHQGLHRRDPDRDRGGRDRRRRQPGAGHLGHRRADGAAGHPHGGDLLLHHHLERVPVRLSPVAPARGAAARSASSASCSSAGPSGS